jgi:hypothetical protein
LIAGISLIASAANIHNILLPFQLLGSGAFSNLIAPMLSSFLINLGIVTIILTLILTALLYAVGLLLGHIALLEGRLVCLEARPWKTI